MPRIRSEKPEGRLTSGTEAEPNNLIPDTQGSLRGLPARRGRGAGLAQENATAPSAFQRIESHYNENQQTYNIAGAAIGGFVIGMLIK